MLAYLKRIKS